MKIFEIVLALVAVVLVFFLANKYVLSADDMPVDEPVISNVATTSLVYVNEKYGFSLPVGNSWKGYIETDTQVEFGRQVVISKSSTSGTSSEAIIPILIYPLAKWTEWEGNNFLGYPTAAPIGPKERGRNDLYVFATAPRYNFDYLDGFEDVENIITKLQSL